MSETAKRHAPKGRLIARDTTNPMRASDPLRCSAHSKQTGKPCTKTPIPGGTVCRYHGGQAPQVKAKALARLEALVDPAITRLAELIADRGFPSTSMAAVKDLLDRAGFKAPEKVEVTAMTVNTETDEELATRTHALLEKAKQTR